MSDLTRAELQNVLGFELSDQQWTAVSAGLGPAVIVAGAGTGKTTSMAARVAWLVGSGFATSDSVLGLTFTTKAAAQLLEAMRKRLDRLDRSSGESAEQSLGEPQVLTYHAFAARILAEHGLRLGLEPGTAVLTDGLRHQLAYRLVCRTDLALAPLGRSPAVITADLLALDDELAELDISPSMVREFDALLAADLHAQESLQVIGQRMLATSRQRDLLAALVEQWRAEKADRGVVDFADQVRLAGKIVDRYPDVVSALRDTHRFVLLDEYQDTSIAQRRLLQRTFGAGESLLAVGDPCQAIYGWRGASVDNIDNFSVHYPPLDVGSSAARYKLTENRRSGPNILHVANVISRELRAVHADALPLEPAASEVAGPGRVVSALFDTYAAEIDWLVQEIASTARMGVPWHQIAVLCATGQQVRDVDAALRLHSVPTYVASAAALLAQPAVVELRCMLEVVHDPTANAAFVRLATGRRWAIGARDLAALGRRAAELARGSGRSAQESLADALDEAVLGSDAVDMVSLSEALEDLGDPHDYSADAVARLTEIATELRDLRRHAGDPLPEFIHRVIRTTGLQVEASIGRVETAERQQAALSALVDLAAEFTALDGRATLGAFLARLHDADRFDVDIPLAVVGSPDAVQLMTVHKAKGLEFGYVFVPFMSTGAFPGGRSRPQWPTSAKTVPWPLRDDVTDPLASFPVLGQAPRAKQHQEYLQLLKELDELESQRLAYVAFTRAERALAVSGHWWGPTQAKPRAPHPYLVAVQQACLDGSGDVAHWASAPPQDATNPQAATERSRVAWPPEPDQVASAALAEVVNRVRSVTALQPALPGFGPSALETTARGAEERSRIADWDVQSAALVDELRARDHPMRTVVLPESVSATSLIRAIREPEALAVEIARPMPRRPASAAARGTRLHAWIEAQYGQQSLIDPDDLPGAADDDIATDEQLEALKLAFAATPYAQRTPVAIEQAFTLVLGGRVVPGRIDAVFLDERSGRYDVVDWKSGAAVHVDAMQLALYRLAWSQTSGVPIDRVDAAFVIIASGEVLRPDTTAELARLHQQFGA